MSDDSFVCETCGETHSGLPRDYGFRLPDDVHALNYLDRYLRSRSNADLCTLDDSRYFFRGVISIPLLESEDQFRWGVWVEVDQKCHDIYLNGFNEDLSQRARVHGRIANDIPAYEGSLGIEVEIQFKGAGDRPFFYFPNDASHALAHEQRRGITQKRHHDLLDAVGFFEKDDS